jgi:Cdc6-like AAA superfamily ATPase
LRKRDASTLAFTYDNLNRMIVKVVPGTTRDVYTAYDILGRQLTAKFDSQAGAHGITNSYDGFGNLTASTISMAGFTKAVTRSAARPRPMRSTALTSTRPSRARRRPTTPTAT